MSDFEILTELAEVGFKPSAEQPSQELLDRGLVAWDGGSTKIGDGSELTKAPAYRITRAGKFALAAWRLPAPPARGGE